MVPHHWPVRMPVPGIAAVREDRHEPRGDRRRRYARRRAVRRRDRWAGRAPGGSRVPRPGRGRLSRARGLDAKPWPPDPSRRGGHWGIRGRTGAAPPRARRAGTGGAPARPAPAARGRQIGPDRRRGRRARGPGQVAPKRGDGPIEAIRALRVARQGALKARTAATNTLRALIVTAPEPLRAQLRAQRSATALVNACLRLRTDPDRLADRHHPRAPQHRHARAAARRGDPGPLRAPGSARRRGRPDHQRAFRAGPRHGGGPARHGRR